MYSSYNLGEKMKKILLLLFGFIFFFSCSNDNSSEVLKVDNTKDKLIFAVPFAPVSYPIMKMIEDSVFNSLGKKTEVVLWKTPDQLRALIVGNQADFFAVPSNVGAMFYNKNIDVKLLNISIWRAIWLVSTSNDKKTIADFKGEEIVMPFKGDMPHIVFMEIAKKQGLDPEKDFILDYVASPMDAAQKMITRRADNALLIDPAVSTVIEKSKSGITSFIAPTLYRSVDLQNEWGRLFGTENEIPFAGTIALGEILEDTAAIELFNKEFAKATEWCMTHPQETAKMVVKYVPQLDEIGVTEAMKSVLLKAVEAKNVKQKLEEFFSILKESKPALIGGELPDSNFYYGL